MPIHKQVDSGLGFECDEGMVGFVRLLNQFPGIKTQYSCQGGRGVTAYAIFSGDLSVLLDFCQKLGPRLSSVNYSCGFSPESGFEEMTYDRLVMKFQADSIRGGVNYGGVRAQIDFAPTEIPRVTRILQEFLDSSR